MIQVSKDIQVVRNRYVFTCLLLKTKLKEESNIIPRTIIKENFTYNEYIFIIVRTFLLFIPFEKKNFKCFEICDEKFQNRIFRLISVNYDRNIYIGYTRVIDR